MLTQTVRISAKMVAVPYNGVPCYTVSYYTYNSVWPYYIVIHITFHITSAARMIIQLIKGAMKS